MSAIQDHKAAQGAATRQALWHNRDYLLLLFGQGVSFAGSQVSQFAFPLLVLLLSGSSAWAGIASALVVVPALFLSLPAGALIDRWDRKRVMILCDIGRALCLASIPVALFIGHLTIIQLCAAALVEGTFYAFFNLAETASLPHVVSEGQLTTAGTQDSAAKNLAFLVGPALGGWLLGVARALPFLFDAVSYTVSIVSLLLIKTAFQERRSAPPQQLWTEIREGLSWLWHTPIVRFFAGLAWAGNALDNSIVLLFIVIATHERVSPFMIGVVYTVVGIGGFLAAASADRVQARFRLGTITLVSEWTTLLLLPFLLVPNILVLGAIITVLTVASALQGTVQYPYRLALIPDALQGRVNSVFRMVSLAGPPLGLALTGGLLQVSGVATAVLFWTALIGTLTVAVTLNRSLRNAPPLSTKEILTKGGL